MSEITKLYKNAGIKPYIYCSKPQLDCDARENGNCRQDCEFYSGEKFLTSFTAEKQIELIKWLGKLDGKLEITCTYNKEKFIFDFYFNRKTDKNPDPKYPYSNFLNADIEILIASIINDIWQNLTSEEKQQVKGILE